MNRDLVFISYSRADESWLDRLLIFLKPLAWGSPHTSGGRVWADRWISVGDEWQRDIQRGLERARVAILLVSMDFCASDFIRERELPELLDAARRGECMLFCIPVSSSMVDLTHPELHAFQWPRPPDRPLDRLHGGDLEATLASVVRALHEVVSATGLASAPTVLPGRARAAAAPPAPPSASPSEGERLRRPWNVPAQLTRYVDRPDVLERIRAEVLASCTVGITGPPVRLGVQGAGGIGKTVCAIELVWSRSVRAAFPDGVYWLTLGQRPDLLAMQCDLLEAITRERVPLESERQGRERLREALEGRSTLLVLDDLWQAEHARAFDVLGERSRLLITTRDASLLTALDASRIALEPLSSAQSLALLREWTGETSLPPEAASVARLCGHVPLALSVAGALIRDGSPWQDVASALEDGNVQFLDHQYASVFTSLRLSLDGLRESERARYLELGVFPEDVPAPLEVVERLWRHTAKLTDVDCRRILNMLENKSLLYLDDKDRPTLRLHDLQRDFVRQAADDLPALHAQLLDAYAQRLEPGATRPWWTLPTNEPYLWHHLPEHLVGAGLSAELLELLLDFRWIEAKLAATDLSSLLADYRRYPAEDASLQAVRGALQLSSHVLSTEPHQLGGQLTGRLLGHAHLERLLQQVRTLSIRPWMRPMHRCLAAPGGSLLRTLEGHTGWVRGVAILPDGRRAISAAYDKTLRVWDLETGETLRTLQGHTNGVLAVAALPDGRRAVSASYDETVRLWDLETGKLLLTLEGHTDWVRAVAVLPDGRRAISAADDATLRIWDLETGKTLQTLQGHTDEVRAVAILPDGSLAISAAEDETLRVWDLETGETLRTLQGHTDGVSAVAALPDGRHVISGAYDATLQLWDLETGKTLRTFQGHTDGVSAVAALPDGRRAVSAAYDETLRVWDLETGETLRTLQGHTDGVSAVAVLPDGRHAVSAADDKTLRVWDLETGEALRSPQGHTGSVLAVAVLPDGRRAISAAYDATLRVWDLETGETLHTLRGHTDWVRAVAVLPDGRRAISAADDATLRVWDLETGESIHTLRGHTDGVNAVAILQDGRRAISAAYDATLRVWDLETGEMAANFALDSPIFACSVAPDGRTVVAGNALGHIAFLRLEESAL